jgi:hypothetical protein
MSLGKATFVLAALTLLGGVVFLLYSRPAGEKPQAVVQAPQVGTAPAEVPREPEPEPVFSPPAAPEAEPPVPLPPLDTSDPEATEALASLAGKGFVERFLVPDAVIRKLVTTIDNLPREKVDMRVRVVPALGGRFLVAGTEDDIVLHPDNFSRYDPFVRLVTAADPAEAAAVYARYYPLLQQAYQELGYPSRQFHGRLLEVIDHLLATPDVPTPIRLVRPHVLYKYAEPDLEARSAGQKALIRMGPEHTAVLKDKLRALRVELIARTGP